MTYWDAGGFHGAITDEFVARVVRYHQESNVPLTLALINDDQQEPPGGVQRHVEDMAARGLLVIESDVVRLT